MKTARVKSDLQVRAALRASQERRLQHACDTFFELLRLHSLNQRDMEHDIAQVCVLQGRLLVQIKNQHVKDRTVAVKRILEGY